MKATAYQTQMRVEEIVRIMLAGASFIDIREYVREKAVDPESVWHRGEDTKPLTESQLRRYIGKANKVIAASTQEKRRKRIERHLAQRQYLYAQAVAAADYRTALAALKDEAELHGMYPPKGLKLTGKDGGPVVLNIIEEIVGRQMPTSLESIQEEVVIAHDHTTGSTTTNDSPPPGPEGLSPE